MQMGVLLQGSCASKTIYGLVRQARAQSQGPCRVYSLIMSGGLTLRDSYTPVQRGLEPVDKLIQDLFPGPISVYYLMHRRM